MAVTDYNFPTAEGAIASEFVTPENAYAEDTAFAYSSGLAAQDRQDYYGFGFNYDAIPETSIIDGIEVFWRGRSSSTSTHTANVQMVKNGVVAGDWAGTQTFPDATYVVKTFGSTSSLWGTTWTAADLVDNEFGVLLECLLASGSGNCRCEYIKIRVTYHAAPAIIEHTSTCSIGLTPQPFIFSLTSIFSSAIGVVVRPVTFALTAIFSAILGLVASCRTWDNTDEIAAVAEASGSEIFTPNEDLTPLEWTISGGGDSHWGNIDDDPTNQLTDPAGTDGIQAKAPTYERIDIIGFSAPTCPDGAVYGTFVVRLVAMTNIDSGALWLTLYAGDVALTDPSLVYANAYSSATKTVEFYGLAVSKTDAGNLRVKLETDADYSIGDVSIMTIYALDTIGYWEINPTGIVGSSITSVDDRTTSILSADDRSISINSK